jgi:hypothetical protein
VPGGRCSRLEDLLHGATAGTAWRPQTLGDRPASSVKRVLQVPTRTDPEIGEELADRPVRYLVLSMFDILAMR